MLLARLANPENDISFFLKEAIPAIEAGIPFTGLFRAQDTFGAGVAFDESHTPTFGWQRHRGIVGKEEVHVWQFLETLKGYLKMRVNPTASVRPEFGLGESLADLDPGADVVGIVWEITANMYTKTGQEPGKDSDHPFGELVWILSQFEVALIGIAAPGTTALITISVTVCLAPGAGSRASDPAGKAEIEHRTKFRVFCTESDTE